MCSASSETLEDHMTEKSAIQWSKKAPRRKAELSMMTCSYCQLGLERSEERGRWSRTLLSHQPRSGAGEDMITW